MNATDGIDANTAEKLACFKLQTYQPFESNLTEKQALWEVC